MMNTKSFKRGQRVISLNCMGVANEEATIMRQMPANYGLADHQEWWLIRFDDSPKNGGLYSHQNRLQALGCNGGPV